MDNDKFKNLPPGSEIPPTQEKPSVQEITSVPPDMAPKPPVSEEASSTVLDPRNLRKGNWLKGLGLAQGKQLPEEDELVVAHERIALSDSQPGVFPELPTEIAEQLAQWEPSIVGVDEPALSVEQKATLEMNTVSFLKQSEKVFAEVYHYQERHNNPDDFFHPAELDQILRGMEKLKQQGIELLDAGLVGDNLDKVSAIVKESIKNIGDLKNMLSSELNKYFGGFVLAASNLLLELGPEIAKLPDTEEIQIFIKKNVAVLRELIISMSGLPTLPNSFTSVAHQNFFDDNKKHSWNSLSLKINEVLQNLRNKYESLGGDELAKYHTEILQYQRWVGNFQKLQQLIGKIMPIWGYDESLRSLKSSFKDRLLLHPRIAKEDALG